MNIGTSTSNANKAPEYKSIQEVRRAFSEVAKAPVDLSEARESGATVAVFDVFSSNPKEEPWHGDMVRSVIQRQGVAADKIVGFDNRLDSESNALLSNLSWGGPDSVNDRLNAYIELSAANLLQRTNGKLQQLLDDPGHSIRVINQSQGHSRAEVFEAISPYLLFTPNPDESGEIPKPEPSVLGKSFAEALGVEAPQDDPRVWARAVKQKLIERIDEVVDTSDLIKLEQSKHAELVDGLHERGILVVTSAGNNADELSALRAAGFEVPEDFDDDITSVGRKLVVGAIDPKDLDDPDDDQVAFFSSNYENVNVYALGVNVPTDGGPATGTSYAAPIVAAAAEKLMNQRPGQPLALIEDEIRTEFPFQP